ncbi:MAG TPA: hypothetical protein PKA20_07445, partial [Burkholderiaceae bacterium]|nr:hypothetical protein [Burkholderiaceae bacterium]
MAERTRQARGSARGAAATGLPDDWPRVDEFITHKLHLLTKLADRGAAEAFASRHGLNLREWRVLGGIGGFAPPPPGPGAGPAHFGRGPRRPARRPLGAPPPLA